MNLVASLQDRLRNEGRRIGVQYASHLEQFALSRFFARLAKSDYADRFILKGAQLFRFLEQDGHRPTRDADFLSFGDHDPEALKDIFTKICQLSPDKEDALSWENIRAAAIRDDNHYGGVRVLITCKLGKIQIPLQFDIGFGDIITPTVRHQTWTAPLDYQDTQLATYPMETVVAEKLEAAVSLGINNSRMKDLYDLHWLQARLSFDGNDLTEAVINTFARRSTVISDVVPLVFTPEFRSDAQKLEQWSAFLRKGKLPQLELTVVIKDIADFLLPVLRKEVDDLTWTPEGHWQSSPPHS
ncbi:nucleotidyl transferase AbiEii/AbiGii toxin family protein [Verrucomicrobiaceae bacterium 5K15]|uniref:Nucleotidyl transferase AbiEii/AbiGii toxin family protein n=1 Tax=Oceaniferula flava TaxID=2800421 RepID=A0AAE2VA01_9BACT|nr:nucleotidyl transferase AbiEii/AbiGii toxin family protein [Oceaniferula flavus]MBK1856033.1 nucleotidyl transferase AbiEii/AbiGii toxin family protein [Oceaniferula flavus]MBM1137340.1 nucleotidyl transferase AbiEii/AbiGii toxin family protein [Oceaniferula flavus]